MTWERKFLLFCSVVILGFVTEASVFPMAYGETWSEVEVLFTPPSGSGESAGHARIALIGESVHAVWCHQKKIYWTTMSKDGTWLEPAVVLGEGFDDNNPEIVSDGKGLHLIWSSFCDVSYRYFDGKTWSKEEKAVLKSAFAGAPKVTFVNDKPFVFWRGYIHGILPHTPGSKPLMYSIRENGTWAEPLSVPNADNVREFVVKSKRQGKIDMIWIDEHMGYLGRNFGLTFGGPKLTLEAMQYDLTTQKWGKPERIAKLQSQHSFEPQLALSGAGQWHVLWRDGLMPDHFSIRTRREGIWEEVQSLDLDKKYPGFVGDIATDLKGCVFVAVYRLKGRRYPCVVLSAGRPDQTIYEAPPGATWGFGDLRMAVSEKGLIHLIGSATEIYYRCFFPE